MVATLTYCDVHAHLADPRILPEADRILADSLAAGVTGILANSARVGEWPAVVTLARQTPVYGALGLHPFFIDEWDPALPSQLEALLSTHSRLVAVGEIGLDFFHGRETRDRQIDIFGAQFALARRLGLPVVLHNRKSWPEFFATVKALGGGPVRGTCHHFSASIEIARLALDLGLYLSFCGPVTYPNARRLKAAAAFAPLDRILTETDTPDLPPAGHIGEHSYPWHVRDVVAELARLRGVADTVIAAAVAANFRQLLGLAGADQPAPAGQTSQ